MVISGFELVQTTLLEVKNTHRLVGEGEMDDSDDGTECDQG